MGEPRGLRTWRLGCLDIWGYPEIRGTFLGIPRIRIIVFLGSIVGSPYFGKLPFLVWNSVLVFPVQGRTGSASCTAKCIVLRDMPGSVIFLACRLSGRVS